MQSLQSAQAQFDRRLPPPVSETPHEAALQHWIEDAAEQLAMGADVVIRRRGWHVATVKYGDFLLRVQEHLTCRLDQDDDLNFAQLVIAAMSGGGRQSMARRLLGPTDHSLGVLHQIAQEMVRPHAEAGLEQDAEDAEL